MREANRDQDSESKNQMDAVKDMMDWKKAGNENIFSCVLRDHDHFHRNWNHLIPLGDKCSPALALTYADLREASYPLDWIVSDPRQVSEVIRKKFKDFYPLNAKGYKNKYGLEFAHFETNSHAYNHEIFLRRIKHFMEVMQSDKRVLFIYTTEFHIYHKKRRDRQDEDYAVLLGLVRYIRENYPQIEFKFLVCNLNKERKHTEDIFNLNLTCDQEFVSDNLETHIPEIYNAYRVALAEFLLDLDLQLSS